MSVSYTGFAVRNPKYVAKNIRKSWAVRKAMMEFDKEHPQCAWCGREGDTDIHHIQPVSFRPDLAADPSNFIPLCRKRRCHQVVGHGGNWKQYNAEVVEVCRRKVIVSK